MDNGKNRHISENYEWLLDTSLDAIETPQLDIAGVCNPRRAQSQTSHTIPGLPAGNEYRAFKTVAELKEILTLNGSSSLISEETLSEALRFLQTYGLDTTRHEFTLKGINRYLMIYMEFFDSVYPIIHWPTFISTKPNTYLLFSMVSIGMALSHDKGVYERAVEINNCLRSGVLLEIVSSSDVPLALFQALLLENYFATVLGSKEQYKISQRFYGTIVSILKDSGYMNIWKSVSFRSHDEEGWRQWIDQESKIRTAFFAFICDCQNATMFRHLYSVPLFDLKCILPGPDSCWMAVSSQEFWVQYEQIPINLRQKRKYPWMAKQNSSSYSAQLANNIPEEGSWPSFLWSVKRLLQTYDDSDVEYVSNCFSQYSRLILLHGLLSICSDMQWRGLMSLGIVSKQEIINFSNLIEAGFTSWRGYFDHQVVLSNSISTTEGSDYPYNGKILNDYSISPAYYTNMFIYLIGSLCLHTDLAAIEQYVGLLTPLVENRDPSTSPHSVCSDSSSSESGDIDNGILLEQKIRLQRKLHAWGKSRESQTAITVLFELLRLAASNEDLTFKIPQMSFGVYSAALVLWCFYVVNEGHQKGDSADISDATRGTFADAKADMLKLIDLASRDRSGRFNGRLLVPSVINYALWVLNECPAGYVEDNRVILTKILTVV